MSFRCISMFYILFIKGAFAIIGALVKFFTFIERLYNRAFFPLNPINVSVLTKRKRLHTQKVLKYIVYQSSFLKHRPITSLSALRSQNISSSSKNNQSVNGGFVRMQTKLFEFTGRVVIGRQFFVMCPSTAALVSN